VLSSTSRFRVARYTRPRHRRLGRRHVGHTDTVAIAHAGGNNDTLVTVYWVDTNSPKAPLTAYDNADITLFPALSAKFG